MLPIDFGSLASKYPKYEPIFRALNAWIKRNPRARFIDPRRLRSELQLDEFDVNGALASLEQSGQLRSKIAVVAPTNHALTDSFFESPEDIPDRLWDTAEDQFFTDDAEIITIYVEGRRD
jgi:hypothetical protein